MSVVIAPLSKCLSLNHYGGSAGKVALLAFSVFTLVACGPQAMAWGSLDVKLGKGEEMHVKKGLFGNKKVAVKDRLGDQYENSNGILGTRHEKIQILGTGVELNQGLLGNKSISAGTILGDKFETHKSFFGLGPRTTKVDLSGASSIAGQLFSSKIMPKGATGFSGWGLRDGQKPGDLSSADKFPDGSSASAPAPAAGPENTSGSLTPSPQWVPMPPRAH